MMTCPEKASVSLFIQNLSVTSASPAQAATCTPTGFVRDGINMTAALINPVTVPAVVNAARCHIGIYIDYAMPGGTVTLNKRSLTPHYHATGAEAILRCFA